jgi:hypothetical protein
MHNAAVASVVLPIRPLPIRARSDEKANKTARDRQTEQPNFMHSKNIDAFQKRGRAPNREQD